VVDLGEVPGGEGAGVPPSPLFWVKKKKKQQKDEKPAGQAKQSRTTITDMNCRLQTGER